MARRIYIDIAGLTCQQKGAQAVKEAFQQALAQRGLTEQVQLVERSCFGLCNLAPNLYVEPDGVWYSRLKAADVPEIIEEHFLKNKPVVRLIHYPDQKMTPNRQGGRFMAETLVAREIEVGEVAPDFTLKDQEGSEVTLSDFRGKKRVVLAFYPFDWSPVCTKENCAISDDHSKFSGKETEIFGISCDSHFSHKAWVEKLGLMHSLLSDVKREVSKKYGLFLEEMNCSKRATVIVDLSGKVIFKKVQEIKVPRNNQEVLSAIR